MPSSSEVAAVEELSSRPRTLGLAIGLVVGLLVLGPQVWGTGFFLRYDMVFVPHLTLSDATLGVDGAVPRAVPNDIVVALLSLVMPGWLVQRLILLGAFATLGAAADRIAWSRKARAATALALCWNPWMYERLSIGHWGYLWGAAGVAWIVAALVSCSRVTRQWRHVAMIGITMASLSGSTGAVLAAVTVIVTWPVWRRRLPSRRVALAWAAWFGLNAAWWWPYLTSAAGHASDSSGVNAFAARAESWAGVVVALLGGGGIWHAPSVPNSHHSAIVGVLAAAWVLLGVGAWRTGLRRMRWAMWALAGVGLAVPLGGALPGVRELVAWFVTAIPGGGLVRDGQKFVWLTVVVAAFGVGQMVEHRRFPVPWLSGFVALAPVALLPGFAWGMMGTLEAHPYPSTFGQAARYINDRGGKAAVFPWTQYRQYRWNGGQTVLDPWPRLLHEGALVNDALPLRDGRHVAGENPSSAAISSALAGDKAPEELVSVLQAHGVRNVVVNTDQPAVDGRVGLNVGRVVVNVPGVQVRDLGPVATKHADGPRKFGLVFSGVTFFCVVTTLLRDRRKPAEVDARGSRIG